MIGIMSVKAQVVVTAARAFLVKDKPFRNTGSMKDVLAVFVV
jgi:hypothetical protein